MVAAREDWDVIFAKVLDEITTTLGYAHVNLSLLSADGTRIRTEQVRGSWLTPEEKQEFKSLADHPVDSGDIQAYVVSRQQIVVPQEDDPRFDAGIHRRFRFHELIRVFIPMIANGVVLGTVEAGYPRKFMSRIYERDVQVLKRFVDYAVAAIGQRRYGALETLGHEFRSAIRGIRANAEALRDFGAVDPAEKVQRKWDGIFTDCDVLQLQVANLEYFLTGRMPPPKLELTEIGPQVIVKTLEQLSRRELGREGLRISDIEYDAKQLARVSAYVDKAQVCQVVRNLFTNAIKYRDRAEPFHVRVEIEEDPGFWTLRIRDWGIGVAQGLEQRIFQEGFRAAEAVSVAKGEGFGLAVSRKIMEEMGGSLDLASNRKPTEFRLRLPKRAAVDSESEKRRRDQ
jgi:signal transduction histidine kinase